MQSPSFPRYLVLPRKDLCNIWPKLKPITILLDFGLSRRWYRRSQSSRMWRRVFGQNIPRVSKYCSAAIFRKAYRLFETSLYCPPATNLYISEDLNLNHNSIISYRKLRLPFVQLACSSYSLRGAMEFLHSYIKSELKDSFLTDWRCGNTAYLNLDVTDGDFNRDAAYSYWGFLDAFAKVWKASISFVISAIRLSVLQMEQLGSHSMDFHYIWYLRNFLKLYREN